MPIAIGIDLGTSHTSVGNYLNGEVRIVKTDSGKTYMPSYISFTKDKKLIGEAAEDQIISNPQNTVFGVKRFIGKRFDDSTFQNDRDYFPYETFDDEGKPKISVTYKKKKKIYDPEEISAMVIGKMKKMAEVQLGHQITSAVITVPASFNDFQRQATEKAGKIAGLKVLHILNEPTAAAIAYGLDKMSKGEKAVVVCNLGSGTFEVSVLKIKHGKTFEVQSAVNDTHFGGDDFDLKLLDYSVDYFFNKHGKDVRQNSQSVRRLKLACEDAKKILAGKHETVIKVDALIDGFGIEMEITRSKFEELCELLFDKIMNMLQKALLESGIPKEEIDDVVLVGGSSRIPKLQIIIADYFEDKCIYSSENQVIVYGAAVVAAILSGYHDKKIKDIMFPDVTPLSIGIESTEGGMITVIERNTAFPCNASHTVTTSTDNQRDISIHVFEGEKALTADNSLIGKLKLVGIPPMPRGVPQITITFEINSEGILKVSPVDSHYKKAKTMTAKLDKGRHSVYGIDSLLKESEEFRRRDELERERIRYKDDLESYIYKVKRSPVLKVSCEKLSDRDQLEIHKICNETHQWLQTNPNASRDSFAHKREIVVQLLQPYESVLKLNAKTDDGRKGSIVVPSASNTLSSQ